MKNHTKVTALLPAYQAGEFIQDTLDSLSTQTSNHFNVLVSVDLCDDDTHEICAKHAKRDLRFRVVRQKQRLGWVGNCNFLLGQAEADHVLFAFHDDILEPTYIEKLSAALDAMPHVVLSYSDVLLTTFSGERKHLTYTDLDGIPDGIQRGTKVLMQTGKWWVPNRGVFRLQEARKIQGLKIHGAGEFSADLPWLFHMSLLGEFVRIPEILCYKFQKSGSLSGSWAFSKEQRYEVHAACMRELWNADMPSQDKLKLAVPLTNWLIKNKITKSC